MHARQRNQSLALSFWSTNFAAEFKGFLYRMEGGWKDDTANKQVKSECLFCIQEGRKEYEDVEIVVCLEIFVHLDCGHTRYIIDFFVTPSGNHLSMGQSVSKDDFEITKVCGEVVSLKHSNQPTLQENSRLSIEWHEIGLIVCVVRIPVGSSSLTNGAVHVDLWCSFWASVEIQMAEYTECWNTF